MSHEYSESSTGQLSKFTRRGFSVGIGTLTGIGTIAGSGQAQQQTVPMADTTYYVYRDVDRYVVASSPTGDVVFTERSDDNAEEAFQYAFDNLPSTGGVVIASPDVFQFSAPATIADNTTLIGHEGTRLVASRVGSRNDPLPTDTQTNPLPRGHDLIRVRGDHVTVAGITFDGNDTQLDNHAVQADGCRDLLVANNRTVNGFQMAISFTDCRDIVIRNNRVENPNWYGITSRGAPEGSDIDLQRSENVVVVENTVTGMKFNNIATYNVSNFTILGNVVSAGGHSLIACSPAQQGTIVGNVCRDLEIFGGDPGGEAGIELEYKESHITDAIAGTAEETSSDITVVGNNIENCPVGIITRTVPADANNASSARANKRPYNFTVTGNTVNGCETGIRVRSGAASVVATNTLRDNTTHFDIHNDYTDGLQRGLNATGQ